MMRMPFKAVLIAILPANPERSVRSDHEWSVRAFRRSTLLIFTKKRRPRAGRIA
jgi:hypothetical protein